MSGHCRFARMTYSKKWDMMREKMMTNGEKFRSLFGISASELWCMNGEALTGISCSRLIKTTLENYDYDVRNRSDN